MGSADINFIINDLLFAGLLTLFVFWIERHILKESWRASLFWSGCCIAIGLSAAVWYFRA